MAKPSVATSLSGNLELTYSYEFAAPAERYLRRLPKPLQEAVLRVVRALCNEPLNPRLSAARHGRYAGYRRARIGNLRLIFRIEADRLTVLVTQLGPRGDIYRD